MSVCTRYAGSLVPGMELVILSSMATAAMADTAAAPMTSSVTAAVSAAVSATATASLDPAGHHVLTQILVSGIVDLGLFAIKILIDRSSILCFALMQVHCGIDQCNDKTCQDPGRKGHRHAFLTFLHGPGHITDTILIRFVGAFVYVIIHCVQGLVDLVIAKIIIDISTGRQPASLLSFIGIVQQ